LVEGGASEEGVSNLEQGAHSSASMGIVATLYRWWRRSWPEDQDNIVQLLDSVDLRFIDPSQAPFQKNNSSGQDSDTENGSSGAINIEAKEKVPVDDEEELMSQLRMLDPGCTQSLIDNYAVKASEAGYSQSEIESVLQQQGISKMSRWKAMKASQQIRTEIALEKAQLRERKQKKDPSLLAAELVPDGSSLAVTVENVGRFLELVTDWWLEHGVIRQVDAFREGLEDVLGVAGSVTLLYNFSPIELRKMLCGKQEVNWKEDDPLLGCIVPMGGYDEDSRPITMLVQALKEMNMKERAQFLSFVTSQPRVPLSGLPEIKVYPPLMDSVKGIVVEEDNPSDGVLHVDDEVELGVDYLAWDDAAHGPLRVGDTGIVTKVDVRVLVQGWWYNPRALRRVASRRKSKSSSSRDAKSDESTIPRSSWFVPGEAIYSHGASAIVESWDPEANTIVFSQKSPIHGIFRKGKRMDVDKCLGLTLRIAKVLEQPEAVQLPPYLRPKATTCAKTMYLPSEYEDYKHMLRIFREAFEDAKLGGIHD